VLSDRDDTTSTSLGANAYGFVTPSYSKKKMASNQTQASARRDVVHYDFKVSGSYTETYGTRVVYGLLEPIPTPGTMCHVRVSTVDTFNHHTG
jgi:hypothetical protein